MPSTRTLRTSIQNQTDFDLRVMVLHEFTVSKHTQTLIAHPPLPPFTFVSSPASRFSSLSFGPNKMFFFHDTSSTPPPVFVCVCVPAGGRNLDGE